MEDDEFGDLYTDVLRPFTAPVQSQFQPQPPPTIGPSQGKEIPKAPTSFQSRPVDLNLNRDDDDEDQDFFGASNSTSAVHSNQPPAAPEPGSGTRPDPRGFDLNKVAGQGAGNSDNLAGFKLDLTDRTLENKDASVRLEEKSFGDPGFMDEADIDVVVEERDEKDEHFVVKDETSVGKGGKVHILMSGNGNVTNFVLGGEESKSGDFFSDTIIPGISSAGGGSAGVVSHGNGSVEDDWDSDSEDDLQIVLNDPNHGPMGGMGGGEDDEDDDDALVIVADNDDPHNQLMIMEEPEWGGEEVGLGDDGERKESGDVSKVNNGGGGPPMAPKIGYSNHGYHQPFPSQFKYVRPGAAPGAPATAGGTPGQVRPPGSMVPVAGRGRGDWRPGGMKVPPGIQKGFHSGYGPPVWGNSASGRGYGSGLEFTLPSHKTIFEVDIDSLEEKPWRLPGIDVTDFFNFGLNEESWKDYCKQLEQFRLETIMQSRIRVYESGRTEQDYDPDLPPELAVAAAIQDVPSEIAKLGKTNDGQIDLSKVPARPTGRAIPVESGYGDRLPSVDTRKPRISDLDVIIEIVCQDPADDDSYPGNDMADQRDNDHTIQGINDRNEFEVLPQEDNDHADHYPSATSRKNEHLGRRSTFSKPVDDDVPEGDESLALSSEAYRLDSADSRERTPVYPGRNFSTSRQERRAKAQHGRPHSPILANNDGTGDKSFNHDQKEETTESAGGNLSPGPLSPVACGEIAEDSVEHKDELSEEIVGVEKDDKINEKEEYSNDTSENDSSKHTSKSQKFSSQVEQAFPQDIDHGEDSKIGRSSDNSKAGSGSSKGARRQHDANEEDDEVHDGRSMRVSSIKKYAGGHEVHIRRKVHDERQDIDGHQSAVRDREELYPPKGLNPYPGSHTLAKYERDRRKEADNSGSVRQRRDEDLHGRRYRAEETRKRKHHDEYGSRHRSKNREIERSEKEEHQIRKQLENGSWRASYDRDVASKHREREDTVKNRNDVTDDIHSKRRKEETYLRKEHTEREGMFHAHPETSSRRKRERDDVFDMRRRDDLPGLRDDDQHSGRIKDVLQQRDRDERQRELEDWHRLRQSSEEISSRKGKGEGSAGVTRGRIIEEKMWASQSRAKGDHRTVEKEYNLKETGRQKEILKRRDRVDNDSLPLNSGREDPYARGTQMGIDERRGRHERASTRDDRATNTSDGSRMLEKKHKQNPRKGKDSEVVDRNSLLMPRKIHNENSAQTSDMVKLKSRADLGSEENNLGNVPSSKGSRHDASSGDEQAEAKRGRSKLERWTSHKERDFSMGVKATSSLKSKQIDGQVATGPSGTNKLPVELSKISEDEQHPPGNEKDAVSLDINNNDLKPIQDRHLDTVEKLKKRSERFRLPMPGEKEITTAKKMETGQLHSAQTENRADSEVKAERPPRRRRWTSN